MGDFRSPELLPHSIQELDVSAEDSQVGLKQGKALTQPARGAPWMVDVVKSFTGWSQKLDEKRGQQTLW
jgi:hypothetical protein